MLKTYTSQGVLGPPVVPMGQSPGWVGQLEPGQQVTHVNGSGFGLIVSVDDMNVVVLWSVEPTTAFDNVAFPIVRRVHPPLMANSIVGIQPVSRPASLVFYLDYTKNLEEIKRRESSRRVRISRWSRRQFDRVKRVVLRVPWLFILFVLGCMGLTLLATVLGARLGTGR